MDRERKTMMKGGYTNIPDWMLDLDLDVYATIILAVIYGFSQDGESTFTGSQNYLARKARCSRQKVATTLPKLVEDGLLIKIDKDIRGVHLCEYRVHPKFTGCNGELQGGCNGELHNTIDINIKDKRDKERTGFVKPSVQEVAQFCRERGNGIDAEEFVAFYESKGWMIGKNHMKSWKSAVITWEKAKEKRQETRSARKGQESVLSHNLKVADKMFGTSLYSQAYGNREDYDEQ